MKINSLKKIKIILITLIITIIAGSLYYYIDVIKEQLKFQKNILTKQIEICGNNAENLFFQFENNLNYIIFSNKIEDIFKQGKNNDILNKLKVFYSKYPNIISNILIYDLNQNVFSIYKDNHDNFITDNFISRNQKILFLKDSVEKSNDQYIFILPAFRNNKVIANISIHTDVIHFINIEFQKYFLKDLLWQWIIDNNGNIFIMNLLNNNIKINNLNTINNELKIGNQGYIEHNIELNGKSISVLSAFYPIRILNEDFGIIFSLRTDSLYKSLFLKIIIIFILSIILVILILIGFYYVIKNSKIEDQKLRESEEAFRQIIELMPVGIIIINKDKKVMTFNKSAQKMLFIDESENLIGTDINHKFFLGKTLLNDSDYLAAYDTNHFLRYEKDEKEVVLFKKDIPIKIKGEEVIVQSLIDVTPLEKSRRHEIVANLAKSEFLARMSHEIRTPMNGIIGMTDSLAQQKLTSEQSEQVNIIKKSSELLLTILNDILDLSKIEAGKMSLEEIPFKLREEVSFTIEIFRTALLEKSLAVNINVADNVPNNLIGDPFRLRQVITNIFGNAIKFTHEGKIEIQVSKLEEYDGNLTLLFAILDTGIGIQKDKITTIFESFSQADSSTTRKYGGTGLGTAISKQLIELMNGEIWAESPSGISDNLKFPGSKFCFTIELFSNEKLKKNIDINNITSFNQIKTIFICENKNEDKAIEEIIKFFGINIEIQCYSKNTLDFLDINKSNYNLLIIKDSPTFDGFKLANRFNDIKLTSFITVLMISTTNRSGSYIKSKRLGIDFYLIYPFETSQLYNIICETFTGIKVDSYIEKTKIYNIKNDLKILVAEDNSINQKVAKTIFKNIGYEIDFANNGLEVLEMVKNQKYDIIFMDIMMPELDGIKATIELLKNDIKIPIVAMTANINKEEKTKAIEAGMIDYVTKPVRVETVKKILIKLFSEDINK